MNTLVIEATAAVEHIVVTSEELTLRLADGRSVSAPLAWYPRLYHATAAERRHWRLIGDGEGVHWPHLDEDISVENILAGKRSGESQLSFKRWLNGRVSQKKSKPTA
jgi:Protein of unknown function (DUF2442)